MTDSEKTDLPGSSRGDDHRETPPQDQHPTVDLSFSDSDRITERDPVESLVAECLARVFAEGESVIEEICANNPENAGDIRAALEALKGVGFTETPSPDFPERLGDFRLRRRLGGGGMGVVYVAEQVSLRREVALKLIRPDQLYFPSARTRFAREIDAIARLQHPGVVPIYAVGEERGLPFFAMELVSGATLAELLSDLQHRLPSELSGCDLADALAKRLGREEARPGDLFSGDWTETCLRIGLHVAEALDHVHGRGILHRDVKPSNVMLTLEGRVLLVDFGLASFEESARITQTGSQPGSLAYMSPEQLEGSVSDVDPRTDIYSLGVTLYEMLGLELPFRERTSEALKSQILAGSPPSLRQRGSTISWETETVCFKAMDPARQSRYASARDLAEDLEHVLRHQPIAARRPGLSLRVKRWMQRHPTASASGAVIALAIAIGSTIVAWQQSQARHALDDSNAELKVAVEKANAESQRARRHFEQTRRAIQEVLFEVGHLGLRDEPHSERVRTRILERAIEHFRELSSENTDARDDPVLRLDIARTQIAMADLLQRLRRDDEALEACGQVRDLITGLTVPTANRPVLERARSEIRKIEADLLSKKGRESEARSLLESNIERLGNLPPESQWSTYAVDHAASWQALGALQLRLLELKDARSSLQRSWEILSPLQAEGGLDLEGARILATTLDFL
ncbi:MAG: protein kinase, partial [Planctomycetota bacterium]